MDRYQRVEKPRVEEPIKENEIRITTQGKLRNYITYSLTMLQVSPAGYLMPLASILVLLLLVPYDQSALNFF